ncbi:hypothetical protein DRJ22_00860 [Candidatus Woesearchaeota archaeon]|nr:MAG: hypothetical protein DRJ22_00860 [Candidatus Woesearchaeota archaeon]
MSAVEVKDILTKSFVKIDINDTVSKMIGKLKKAKKYYGLAFDKGKYLGFVGKRFLLTNRINPSVMKVKNILKKRSKSKTPFFVPVLKPETSLQEACRLIASADVRALPVMDKSKKIIGVLDAVDIAKAIKDEYKGIPCVELASMKLVKVKYDERMDRVFNLMNRKNIDHIPVVDEKNRIIGLIAMGDIMEEYHVWEKFVAQKIPKSVTHGSGKQTCYEHGEKISILSVPVENILIKNVCTINPDKDIKTALQKMIKSDKSSVILVEDKEPVGILTLRDVFLDYSKAKLK